MATHNPSHHPNVEILPDLVIINIFQYLDFRDLCKMSCVCRRWHRLSQSKSLWKYLCVNIENYEEMKKLLPYLPANLMHLKLGNSTETSLFPISLPQIMNELADRCPFLNSLRIDRAISTCSLKRHFNIEEKDTIVEETCGKNNCEENDYLNIDIPTNVSETKYPVLKHLKILSIHRTLFDSFHFLSNIDASDLPELKVLDITGSSCVFSQIPVSLNRLSNLQELYLGSSGIQIEVLQGMKDCLKQLKVLDLEGLYIESDALFDILKDNQGLEKLYLGYSELINDDFLSLMKQYLFPHLTVLCLRYSGVSWKGVTNFVKSWGFTKSISIMHCCGLQLYDNFCDHFLENHRQSK